MPIYAGGGVSASTRQAAARYGQAMYEMDTQVGSTLNDLRKQFNLCISSRAKLAAYELAVKSATTQVTATRQSVLAGQRVNVDVLNAEQQLYSAQRDLASAKYTYIKSWITLLSDSGTLDEKDVKRVAQYFAISRWVIKRQMIGLVLRIILKEQLNAALSSLNKLCYPHHAGSGTS